MKSLYKLILCSLLTCMLFTACEEEDSRTVYPHSTPVIESATLDKTNFTYGDSLTLTAKLSDPTTPLSTLDMTIVANDVIIAQQTIRTAGTALTISAKFKTELKALLPANADVEVRLSLTNVEGDVTNSTISGITAKRKYYSKLYLVLESEDANSRVIELKPESATSDDYLSATMNTIKANNIRYKVAEKITTENDVDYSGDVFGYQDDQIKLINEFGDYITASNSLLRNIKGFAFNTYQFKETLTGDIIDPNNLTMNLDDFEDATVNGEAFKKISMPIKENQEIILEGGLDDADIIFQMEYFEHTASDKVKFTGDAGTHEFLYSPSRKIMFYNVKGDYRKYPNVLLAAGMGLGYPSKAKQGATTEWNFDAPLHAIVFRKTADNVFEAVVYFDATMANFKFYENDGWANEKKSDDFLSLPAIIINSADHKAQVDPGANIDGNWYAAATAASGNYKITVNLNTKVVTATPVTLP